MHTQNQLRLTAIETQLKTQLEPMVTRGMGGHTISDPVVIALIVAVRNHSGNRLTARQPSHLEPYERS